MKAAFVINDLSGGGAEKALVLLTDYLAGVGVDTRVITLESGNDGYRLNERVDRTTLRAGRLNHGAGKVLGLPLQAAELARILRAWQPDVCVSFLPRSNVAHVLTRWFGNRNAVIVTEQVSSRDAYPRNGVTDRVMRSLIRRFYPRADVVFTSSDGVLAGLTGFGVRRERMQVVYNPISLKDIQARASARPHRSAMDGRVPTIITVGRYAAQKDHATLLRSFAILRGRVPARLVLVGQGPLENSLKELALELGIDDSVVFTGWQANPFAWMAEADLFVLSSRFEGFGNVIVEAMACGLPVISTDCPSGPREILQDGDSGILVPVGDVARLAEALHSVLADHGLREQLILKSRGRAPDFDISVIGAEYRDLLESCATRTAVLR